MALYIGYHLMALRASAPFGISQTEVPDLKMMKNSCWENDIPWKIGGFPNGKTFFAWITLKTPNKKNDHIFLPDKMSNTYLDMNSKF